MRRAVVGAAASLLALSCATVPPPLSAPKAVVLTGIVTDSATSQPLAGAIVTLPGGTARAWAAPDGRYRLVACLARGSQVILSAWRNGHGTKWLPVRVDSDTARVDPRLEVHQLYEPAMDSVGEEREDVVFSGTVTDATLRPLPGAVVALGVDSAVAGPDGRYKFVARKAIGSKMNIQARRGGYYTAMQPVRVSTIRTVRADFRLSPVVPVEGC